MKGSHVFIIAHIIFVPLGILIIADDMRHPERWDTSYRNPAFSIPYCVGMESFIVVACVYRWKNKQRREEGLRLLKEAVRLQQEGYCDDAEAAYQEGCRLCGIGRR